MSAEPPFDARANAWGAELRRVHARLREALELARASVSGDAPAGQRPADLLIYCWGFCEALAGHHTSEDTALFPQITAARPDLAPVVARLKQDHSMISYLITELRHGMESGVSQAAALSHLDGIGAVMESHFGYEERQLVEVLDAADGPAVLRTDPPPDPQQLFGAIA